MSAERRAKIEAFYKAYAKPDEMAKMDNAINSKLADDALFAQLRAKYKLQDSTPADTPIAWGLPASSSSPSKAPPAKAPAAAPGAGAAAASSSAPAGRPPAAKGTVATTSSPAAKTEPARSDSASAPASSPVDESASATPKVAETGPKSAATPAKQEQKKDAPQQKAAVAAAGGGNDDDDDVMVDPADGGNVEDTLRSIVSKSGFLCREHEHRWVQTWLGSLPLTLLMRESVPGKNPVIIQAWGYKHARKGLGSAWKRRFFFIVPPFLYYSDSDSPSSKCRGCVYLARATMREEVEKDGKAAIVIESRVNRRPDALDSSGDAAPYYIAFETERVRDTWKTVADKVAKAPYNPTTGHIEQPPLPAEKQQQQLIAMAMAGNPLFKNGSFSFMPGSPSSGSGFAAPAGTTDPTSAMLAASMSPLPPSTFCGLTPSNANANAFFAPSSDMERFAAATSFSSGGQQPQSPVPLSRPLAMEASGSTATDLVHQLMQQQLLLQQQVQQLQQQLKEQQEANNRRQQPSSASSAAANNTQTPTAASSNNSSGVAIDPKDLLARIRRIAADRDPEFVLELLFSHFEAHMGDVGTMWKMMLALDDAPKARPPQQQMHMQLQQQMQMQPSPRAVAVERSRATNDRWSQVTASVMQQQQQNRANAPQQQQQPNTTDFGDSVRYDRGLSESSTEFFAPAGMTMTMSNNIRQQPMQQQQQQQQPQHFSQYPLSPVSHQQQSQAQHSPQRSQQQQQQQVGASNRSDSFDLMPLRTGMGSSSAGGGMDSVTAALNKSSSRKQMIDQMLSGLPK